jgi:hypothetical protein
MLMGSPAIDSHAPFSGKALQLLLILVESLLQTRDELSDRDSRINPNCTVFKRRSSAR